MTDRDKAVELMARALRDPYGCLLQGWGELMECIYDLIKPYGDELTPLGRAVLAELDAREGQE